MLYFKIKPECQFVKTPILKHSPQNAEKRLRRCPKNKNPGLHRDFLSLSTNNGNVMILQEIVNHAVEKKIGDTGGIYDFFR